MMRQFLVDKQQIDEVDDFVEPSDIWQNRILLSLLNIQYRCIMF